jgi:RHS repeat-associated protein
VFLVANQTGVQGVFGSSGATDEIAVYSPYGKQTITSGSAVTPFGFQGSYTDATGLIYLINRYYDPITGSFVNVDPDVMTTGQPYAYADDDSVNVVDPSGDIAVAGPPPPPTDPLPIGPLPPMPSPTPPSSGPTAPLPGTGSGSGTTTSSPGPLLFGGVSSGITIYSKTATFYGTGVVVKISVSLAVSGPDALTSINIDEGGDVSVSVEGGKPTKIVPIQTSVSGGIDDLTFTASQNTNVGADAISTNLSLNIRVTPVDPFSVGEIVTAGVAAIAAVGDACAVNPVGCVIIAGAG